MDQFSEALTKSVERWYTQDPSREQIVQQIINGKAGVSLREIDHFVTNMSARDKVMYFNDKADKVVDVNNDYKDILRCYHKCNFDTFKRRNDNRPGVSTDLKQKVFFRWAVENGIVDYVSRHVSEINNDMLIAKKKQTKTKHKSKSKVAILIKPIEIKLSNKRPFNKL